MKIGFLMQEGGPDVRQKPLTGPANHVWQVIRELRGLGHQVRLMVCYDHKIWRSDDLEHFEAVKVPHLERGIRRRIESLIRGTQSRLHIPYLNLFDSIRFSHACQQELVGYDLFYERMGWMGYGGGLAARKQGVPLVLEANNGDHITELKMLGIAPHGIQLRISIALMKLAVHRANHVIATGQGHRDRFLSQWKLSPDKITVIENGSELVNTLQRDQLKSFLPQEQSSVAIQLVFVGALEPWHGIQVLLPALSQALSRGLDLHLTLIGTGTELERIKQLIDELNLGCRVTLTGRLSVQQLAPHLTQADIGLSPYCGWMEFTGLKLFDYKAAGLAIIASGQDGQPAILRHGQTGWIVPPCDADALSEAIVRLATDAELRQHLGQNARLEAEKMHSWGHTAQKIDCIFQRLLSEK